MIIPSIDIIDGKAVQLKQGKEKILERKDVIDLAKNFNRYGEIAVIDLDAAMNKGDNFELIRSICKIADCRVGGGIRTIEKANSILSIGAKKIIIGTNANREFLGKLPKDRLIVAIDMRNNEVLKEGWTKSTGKTPFEVINNLEDYCSEFLFTNVEKEGMMQGLDFDIVENIRRHTTNRLTVAGGISTIDDITKIEQLEANSQIGMSIYTGAINLQNAFLAQLNFNKDDLIPTIVQDDTGQVLMLAYSSKESIEQTFDSSITTYYSRSRQRLWTKGEESGNIQSFIKARYDCDRDALLYIVKQKNVACHTGKYSCFSDKDFSFGALYEVIKDKLDNPDDNSYTSKLLRNEHEIIKKIKEESSEVVNYTDRDNLIWEIADLSFFCLSLMVKHNIQIDDIKNELWKRRK